VGPLIHGTLPIIRPATINIIVFLCQRISQQTPFYMLQARVSKFNSSFNMEVAIAKPMLCKLHPEQHTKQRQNSGISIEVDHKPQHGRRSGGALSPPPFVSIPSYHPCVSRLLWEMNSAFRKQRCLLNTLPLTFEGSIESAAERTLSLKTPKLSEIDAYLPLRNSSADGIMKMLTLPSRRTPVYHQLALYPSPGLALERAS
jgi:hypothetical protein